MEHDGAGVGELVQVTEGSLHIVYQGSPDDIETLWIYSAGKSMSI